MATLTDTHPGQSSDHAIVAADEAWSAGLERFCILCGWRGTAPRCCRCAGWTLVEELPVRRLRHITPTHPGTARGGPRP